MDIAHLENYVEMKINDKHTPATTVKGDTFYSLDGRRVALSTFDGQTIVLTEYQGGFYKLRDGNWELSWEQKDIDDWNTKHGLSKEDVEKIIDDSFYNDWINCKDNTKQLSYLEQLDKYNSKKNKE